MFNLFKNKYLIIHKETSAGIPLEWHYRIEDPSIVELDKVENNQPNKRLKGGPIYKDFYFKGLKQGETTIIFEFIHVNGRIDSTDYHKVIVDKKLNIQEKRNENEKEIINN